MSSIIKKLIQDNKEQLSKQDNWKETSFEKQFEALKCQKLGEELINLLIIGLTSNENIRSLNQAKQEKKKKKLLQNLSKKHQISIQHFQRILGIYVQNSFEEGGFFQRLFKQSDAFYQTDEQEQQDINEDDGDGSTNFYTKANEDRSNSLWSLQQKFLAVVDDDLSSMRSVRKPNKQQSRYNQLTFDLSSIKSHQKIVDDYLSTLAAPQTQMMNLCGQFNWKGYFRDKARGSDFQVFAIIDFEYKKCNKQLVESAVYKNKKNGRIIAAFKMLRKLYISFPEIWQIYHHIKNNGKSLQVQKADLQTSSILKSHIRQKNVQVIKLQKEKSIQFEKEVNKYLSQITNFKSQMNILLQQITGIFNHPKMEKIQDGNGLWKVKGFLILKDLKEEKEYVSVEVNKNSKQAEEKVARKLLTEMYMQNRSILERMAMVKAKKGIKT